jgi:tetratricopeptide (TPR) repeat protein
MFLLIPLLVLASTPEEPIMYGPVSHRALGRIAINNLNFVTTMMNQLLIEHPDDPNVLGMLGAINSRKGNFQLADELLIRSSGSPFYEAQGLYFHGLTLYELGEHDAALRCFRELLLFKDLTRVREYMAHKGIINTLRAQGRFDDALDAVDDALAVLSNAGVYVSRADIYLDVGDIESAEQELLFAEWYSPWRNPEAVYTRARLLTMEGNLDEAEALLSENRRPNKAMPYFWFQLGELQLLRDELYASEHILNMIRLTNNEVPEKRVLRARHLSATGDRAAALSVLEEGLTELPHHPLYHQLASELGVDP